MKSQIANNKPSSLVVVRWIFHVYKVCQGKFNIGFDALQETITEVGSILSDDGHVNAHNIADVLLQYLATSLFEFSEEERDEIMPQLERDPHCEEYNEYYKSQMDTLRHWWETDEAFLSVTLKTQ